MACRAAAAWLCLTCGALRQLPRQGHQNGCRRPHNKLMAGEASAEASRPPLNRRRRTSTRATN